MSEDKPRRFYQRFNPDAGYPAGSHLFYECRDCGEIVPSRSKDSIHCKCRNIMIDADYGRMSIQNHRRVKLFSIPGDGSGEIT